MPPTTLVRAVEFARHHLYRLHQRMAPPPAVMAEMISDSWLSQAITVAARLRIADTLAAGPLAVDALATRVDADPDALHRMLRALVSRGVFRRRGDGRYELNALGRTLQSDVPGSMAGLARFKGSRQHREHWSLLEEAVRTGKSTIPMLRGQDGFDYLASEPELADDFNQAMTSFSELAVGPVVAAYDFSAYPTIVDVGGGHGRLLAAVLAATPGARGVLYDLPHVVAGAGDLLRAHAVDSRVRIAAGSFFDGVPAGGDAYVLKNVVHDWADDQALAILRNIRTVAGDTASLLLVESVIPRHERESVGKWLDLEMLVATSARERTANEYRDLLARAGWAMRRVISTPSPFSIVEAMPAI
ncbi:methyltransferase [Mycolicibacterium chubuense]|nr:methyltransferase [Mycolicibacterium chubuense]